MDRRHPIASARHKSSGESTDTETALLTEGLMLGAPIPPPSDLASALIAQTLIQLARYHPALPTVCIPWLSADWSCFTTPRHHPATATAGLATQSQPMDSSGEAVVEYDRKEEILKCEVPDESRVKVQSELDRIHMEESRYPKKQDYTNLRSGSHKHHRDDADTKEKSKKSHTPEPM